MADMAKPEDAGCLVVDGTDCANPAVGKSEARQVSIPATSPQRRMQRPAPVLEKAFLQSVTARFAQSLRRQQDTAISPAYETPVVSGLGNCRRRRDVG
jgi:hypothetical protein